MGWISAEYARRGHSPATLRRFGFRCGVLFLLLGLWFGRHYGSPGWLIAGVGAGGIAIAEFHPKLLRVPHHGWVSIAAVLGVILPPVLLTVVFYLLVTPIRLIQRAVGFRALDLRFKTDATSYWQQRERGLAKKSYERQF